MRWGRWMSEGPGRDDTMTRIDKLKCMTVGELRVRHAEVFGEPVRSACTPSSRPLSITTPIAGSEAIAAAIGNKLLSQCTSTVRLMPR